MADKIKKVYRDKNGNFNVTDEIEIAKELNDPHELGKYFINISQAHNRMGKVEKALEGYNEALRVLLKAGDKNGAAICYNSMGNIYTTQGNYPIALECLHNGLKIREEMCEWLDKEHSVFIRKDNYDTKMKDYDLWIVGVNDKLTIDFTYRYRNYSTISGPDYLNSLTVNSIVLENDFATTNIGVDNTFFKVADLVSINHPSVVGGQDSFIKTIGPCTVVISKGDFYVEKFNNLIQMDSDETFIDLTNFDASAAVISDSVNGAFKFNGTPGVQKYVWVQDSIIRDVKQGTPQINYILPSAGFATVNGAMFTLQSSYPDDAAALAGGLISNNIYFNTTTNSLTRIV